MNRDHVPTVILPFCATDVNLAMDERHRPSSSTSPCYAHSLHDVGPQIRSAIFSSRLGINVSPNFPPAGLRQQRLQCRPQALASSGNGLHVP
jgi:hypothetical protein